MKIDLATLMDAVDGTAAAFRCVTDYQPAGGPGDKVFPPTYEGGKYATEERIDPETGEVRPCVLLDSVQSQANRMELALLESHRAGTAELPLLVTRFDQPQLLQRFTVTSLEAPHRIADALFRDSLLGNTIFRKSEKGRILDTAEVRNATNLFGLCPTALVFGLWDSTGPRGGLGAKFQRAIVSEIIGYDAVAGKKTASRIDSAQIRLGAGPLYERGAAGDNVPDWTLDEESALLEKSKPKKLGKDGKPSEAIHGNITPSISDGGFTISKARQTTTLSLAVLRRLRFPLDGAADSDRNVDLAARTWLRGVRHSRTDAVHGDARGRQLQGQALGEADDAALGGRVVGAVSGPLKASAGGDADNAAASLLQHLRRHRPAAQERPEQVGADDPLPFALGHVLHRARGVDAGVVDQDIDLAETVEAGLHHGVDGGSSCDTSVG